MRRVFPLITFCITVFAVTCYADVASDAISVLLDVEGGYVKNLHDTGEETNFGISKKSYPYLDIKHLTRARAEEIYRKQWWEPLGCDSLPPVLATEFLCFAVNAGRREAVKLMDALGEKKRCCLVGYVQRARGNAICIAV